MLDNLNLRLLRGEGVDVSSSLLGRLYTGLGALGIVLVMVYNYFFPIALPPEEELPTPLSFNASLLFMFSIIITFSISYFIAKEASGNQNKFNLTHFLLGAALAYLIKGVSLLSSGLDSKTLLVLDLLSTIFFLIAAFLAAFKCLRAVFDYSRRPGGKIIRLKDNLKVGSAYFGFEFLLGATYLLFYWILTIAKELYGIPDPVISQVLTWWFRLMWLLLTLFLVVQVMKKRTAAIDKKGNEVQLMLKATVNAGVRQAVLILILISVLSHYPGFDLTSIWSNIVEGAYTLNKKVVWLFVKFAVWLNFPIDWKTLLYTNPQFAAFVAYIPILVAFLVLRKYQLI